MIVSGRYDFKVEKGNIIFTGKYMEVYVPAEYEEKGIMEIIGDHFKTLGILNFRTFNDIDGKKPNKLKVLNLPMEIHTYPSGGFEIKKLDLVGKGEESYYVLKYYNTDVLCPQQIAQSATSFANCLDILLAGKLPATIPYDGVSDIWAKSFKDNGVSFEIPELTREIVVAQIYRSKKNPGKTFGWALNHEKCSMYDYITMNPRELTKNESTYTGITFEDFDSMAISGLNNAKSGKAEHTSPMEKIMKF